MPTPFGRTILIVDDDNSIREHLCGFFNENGWDVIEASGGMAALQLLEKRNWSCNCIILDKRMPGMDGLTFLKALREKESGVAPIPVIVLSAYVENDADVAPFIAHGTARVFQKPQETELLAAVAGAVLHPMSPERREMEIERAISAHEIDEKVKHHEDVIGAYYRAKMLEQNDLYQKIKEPLFVVARRWNSWYPSFFDVPGGAYATVFPKCKKTRRNRVAVVDPGFRFLNILSKLGLSVQDLETCIITHNHPDHMGGVFEYIACRYEAGKPASFLCNPSTQRMLSQMAQANVTPRVLPENNKEDVVLSYNDSGGTFRSLGVRAFATDHREVGWDSDSRGLVLTCHTGEKKDEQDSYCRTVILGDSAFDETNRDMDFPTILAGDENTKIVILHIGSAQIKRRAGGHLYLTGLGRLVQQLAAKLEGYRRNRKNKLVVLVSEWGLEHANASQMSIICPDAKGFDDVSAIVSTIDFLRNNLKELGYDRLTILPADIGLIIGMESGLVYLKSTDGQFKKVPAEQVTFTPTADGLQYSRSR
jgi:CheY-like chemotaxis protein